MTRRHTALPWRYPVFAAAVRHHILLAAEWVVLTAVLVAIVGVAIAGAAELTPCYTGFDVAAEHFSSRRSGIEARMSASGGQCTFPIRLCANMGTPGCTAGPVDALVGRGAVKHVPSPESLIVRGACGEWSEVTVSLRDGRVSRRRLRAGVRNENGRWRPSRLTLVCLPATTTTSTTLPPPGTVRECEGITGRTVGRLVDFAPSLPIASCYAGQFSSNYLTPTSRLDASAPEELHVISVYEGTQVAGGPRGFGEHPQGVIDVTIRPTPRPIALYLGSYEPERWRLQLEPGARISRILTFGYYEQVVEGVPTSVPVTALGYEQGLSCMYGWELAASEGGCPFIPTMQRVRELTGLVETTFQGCYSGDHFVVPHADGPPPPCEDPAEVGDETIPRRDVALPGCESVTRESEHCLTSASGTLAVVGLDTGTVCPLASSPPVDVGPGSPTLAWRGEAAYACLYGIGLVRASLEDGSVLVGQMPCTAVALDDEGRLLVSAAPREASDPYGFPTTNLYAFDSWRDALAGRAAAVYPDGWIGWVPERLTVRDGIVYRAWHSTDTIDRSELATGTTLPSIGLQGYDGWILGLAVTGDGRLVIPGDSWGDTIRVFDAATGLSRPAVQPSMPVQALACVD